MLIEIPLKLKYRTRKPWGRFRADYGGNNNKAKPHRPLSEREKALHAMQPRKVLVLLASGKKVMRILAKEGD